MNNKYNNILYTFQMHEIGDSDTNRSRWHSSISVDDLSYGVRCSGNMLLFSHYPPLAVLCCIDDREVGLTISFWKNNV